MAGDWIKIEHATPDKPEVVRMAGMLGIDQDAVVGKLLRLWIWADQQTVDGNGISVTDLFIDRCTFLPGFANALRQVGWLEGRDGRLSIPNFDRHNGQSSKQRALTARRVADCKNRKSKGNAPIVTEALPKALPREEKRREEKDTPQTPHGESGEKPKTDLSQLASRIASLVPEWSPHFSHIERVNLVDNLGKWEGLTESDWRTLEAWYADNTEASKFRAGKAKLLESPDEEVVKARRAGFSASATKAKRKITAPEGWQAVYASIDPNPIHVDGEYCAPDWERLTPSEQSEVVGRMAANPSGLPQDRVSTPGQGQDSGHNANPPQNRNQRKVA